MRLEVGQGRARSRSGKLFRGCGTPLGRKLQDHNLHFKKSLEKMVCRGVRADGRGEEALELARLELNAGSEEMMRINS